MNNPKLKPYAVTLSVKPKQQGIYKYSSRSYRGIVMAKNTNDAKEQAIQVLLISFKDNDGSSTRIL